MSRTIKANRYNTLAACIRRSIWNDIAYPLAVDRRCAGPKPSMRSLSRSLPLAALPIDAASLPLSRWARPPFRSAPPISSRARRRSQRSTARPSTRPTGPTAIINLFTGRPARGKVNRLMADPARCLTSPPRFPTAGGARGALRSASEAAGSDDFSPRWAGQSFPLACRLMHRSKTAALRSPRRRNSTRSAVYLASA
jgi:hypothetical protein